MDIRPQGGEQSPDSGGIAVRESRIVPVCVTALRLVFKKIDGDGAALVAQFSSRRRVKFHTPRPATPLDQPRVSGSATALSPRLSNTANTGGVTIAVSSDIATMIA